MQTFLALFALLALLSACSQKLPPHPSSGPFTMSSDTSGNNLQSGDNGNNPNNKPPTKPDSVIKPSEADGVAGLTLDSTTSKDQWTLKLSGTEASKIYKLMVVAPTDGTVAKTKVKQGSQFSCTETATAKDPTYDCEFVIAMPAGNVKEVIATKDVKHAAAEIAQASEGGAYITIPAPVSGDPGAKITLSVLSDIGKTLYEGITVPDAMLFGLDAGGDYLAGQHKAAPFVNCLQQQMVPQSDPKDQTKKVDQPKTYSCYLHLNLYDGSVDKTDPNSLN